MRRSVCFAGACTLLLMGAGTARADRTSSSLIRRARQTAAKARTLQADVSFRFMARAQQGSASGTARLMKPGYARVQVKGLPGAQDLLLVSDLKQAYLVMGDEKEYIKAPPVTAGAALELPGWNPLLTGFFQPDVIAAEMKHRFLGKAKSGGRIYQVVQATGRDVPTLKLYFGPSGLLEGVEMRQVQAGQPSTVSLWLKNIHLNAPILRDAFAFVPPSDFAPFSDDPNRNLLAEGKEAPDFELPTPEGERVSLSGARRGKKAVLVNFWFYDCPACQAEFPSLQKLYEEYRDQGLELIAVNAMDPPATVRRQVEEGRYTFKIVQGGEGESYTLGKAYGVRAYPTNYLVGADGKIVWRGVGFAEQELRAAIERTLK